jgi:hypothetical protein
MIEFSAAASSLISLSWTLLLWSYFIRLFLRHLICLLLKNMVDCIIEWIWSSTARKGGVVRLSWPSSWSLIWMFLSKTRFIWVCILWNFGRFRYPYPCTVCRLSGSSFTFLQSEINKTSCIIGRHCKDEPVKVLWVRLIRFMSLEKGKSQWAIFMLDWFFLQVFRLVYTYFIFWNILRLLVAEFYNDRKRRRRRPGLRNQ